jgi:hypothetical protein
MYKVCILLVITCGVITMHGSKNVKFVKTTTNDQKFSALEGNSTHFR